MSQTDAYIGLGTNLGERKHFIDEAAALLGQTHETEVVKTTEPVETIPLGHLNQPPYLNAVVHLKTNLSASNLHKRLIEIEDALERKRGKKWASRNIDLDLLLFGNEIIKTDRLIVPHPQMHLRSFVLTELCKINPKLVHPVLNETVDVLASRLNGDNYAPLSDKSWLVSIAGNIGAGKTTLTKKLAASLYCRSIFEAYDKNPFLPKVYAGNKDLALSSQLFFLTSRVEQLNPSIKEKNTPLVTDYVFQKELIYANLLLSKEQQSLYNKIYSQVEPCVVRPSLVLWLTDSPQVCLERIHSRNRPYEQQIQLSFLQAIDSGYKEMLAGWKISPVIALNDFDCLSQQAADKLAEKIKYYINPSSTYNLSPAQT